MAPFRSREWQSMRRLSRATLLALALWLTGCEPEVGSERWCATMRDKPRGDWTANEALEFARSCVLGGGDRD
jgi:hypothetical protein